MTRPTESKSKWCLMNHTSKWLYYLDSIPVLRTSFCMYEQDVQDSGHEYRNYPTILVVLSSITTLLIWAHFMYPKKVVVLMTSLYILSILVYRSVVATSFLWFLNVPHFAAFFLGLFWAMCDMKHHQPENWNDRTSPCSPTASTDQLVDEMGKGTKQSEEESTSSISNSSYNKVAQSSSTNV